MGGFPAVVLRPGVPSSPPSPPSACTIPRLHRLSGLGLGRARLAFSRVCEVWVRKEIPLSAPPSWQRLVVPAFHSPSLLVGYVLTRLPSPPHGRVGARGGRPGASENLVERLSTPCLLVTCTDAYFLPPPSLSPSATPATRPGSCRARPRRCSACQWWPGRRRTTRRAASRQI